MGVPASGKSTWCRLAGPGVVLSADEVRTSGRSGNQVLDGVWWDALQVLMNGQDVTIDACSLNADRRAGWLRLAEVSSHRARLVILDVSQAEVLRRNARRHEAERVPRALMVRYLEAWPAAVAAARREPWDEFVDGGTRSGDW